MENSNPLQKYYRQPSIYVSLPSKGAYYDENTFTPSESGEIPVYPMTAKDEIAFKTPDGLINGESTVRVIKSCVPNLKNPWNLVNYDLDTVLLAIRVASYGETMDISATVPNTNEQISHSVNLPALLETVKAVQINEVFTTKENFSVKVKPLTYKQINEMQQKTFEQQKTVSAIEQSELSLDEKNKRFQDCFKALTDLNFDVLEKAIAEITTPDGDKVQDPNMIKEFIANANATMIKQIQEGVNSIRNQAVIKPLQMKSTEDQIKKGAPVNYTLPITFDNANFFV